MKLDPSPSVSHLPSDRRCKASLLGEGGLPSVDWRTVSATPVQSLLPRSQYSSLLFEEAIARFVRAVARRCPRGCVATLPPRPSQRTVLPLRVTQPATITVTFLDCRARGGYRTDALSGVRIGRILRGTATSRGGLATVRVHASIPYGHPAARHTYQLAVPIIFARSLGLRMDFEDAFRVTS